jgi:hypothetical protein
MKADTTITVTPAVVKEWEDSATLLEQEAAQKLEEAKLFRAKAQAGALLLGTVLTVNEAVHAAADAVADVDPGNMMEAMELIANSNDRPLTKSTMKARLMTLGYADERMGNYFYTCVARLKNKGRITVLPDGRMWKAPE